MSDTASVWKVLQRFLPLFGSRMGGWFWGVSAREWGICFCRVRSRSSLSPPIVSVEPLEDRDQKPKKQRSTENVEPVLFIYFLIFYFCFLVFCFCVFFGILVCCLFGVLLLVSCQKNVFPRQNQKCKQSKYQSTKIPNKKNTKINNQNRSNIRHGALFFVFFSRSSGGHIILLPRLINTYTTTKLALIPR